jgi:hypothetical protein
MQTPCVEGCASLLYYIGGKLRIVHFLYLGQVEETQARGSIDWRQFPATSGGPVDSSDIKRGRSPAWRCHF